MKPGLRKVIALILVSVTLFGSGASVVSAAYADDTTMGTSTRIQAEPDVKTTTGGDEAATKPDAGSGDEAGTGADEQSGTGAPAQSAPQADAGQAAPDVTVHDMLDTDSAAVSRLRLTDRITGTAPFDKDNERGDDKDENNDIVRSYDTVTYDYEYTLTPDSTMDYYRRTRVGFRFELPYPKDKVTFDAEKMGWVDHTPGYEPKLTTETIDGIVTQVYTCYRLLEPTSQSPTVNPGTGSIGLSVAVKGAPHGYRFHPTVKAWPAWDASNPTNTGTHKRAEDTPKDVTVSAKLNLNVRMVDYGNVDRGVFDFSSGAANAPNRTEGKVTGLGLGIALVTEMRWPDRTKGLKGLEAPSGRITYRLRLSNQYSDDTKAGTKHPMERRWQPLLYDYGHIDNEDSKYGRTFAWMGDLRYRAPGVADHADGNDRVARGNTTITTTTGGQGTDVTVSFDGYDTSVFPIHNKLNGTHNKCSTDYMTSDCSTMQVGAIHMDVLQFITPTSRDGRTVAQYYGNVDQTANITMDDMGLTATGVSGDRLATAEDNSNQAATGDDHAGSALTVRMPGTYSTRIRYTCWNNDRSWNDAGTSGDWTQPDYGNGSDSLIQGSKLRLQIGHNIIINSEGDAEVMGMGLVKLDPNSIEPVDDHPDTQPTIPMNVFTWGMRAAKRRNAIPYWYAVKKDGTKWKDYREQRDTKISGLDYYPTLNEAKRHGTIVGMLFEDHNTVDPTGTSFNRTFTPLVALPANARYDFSLAFKPTGNKAADSYVNRWADGDNKVDAVTQVVERKVNGVAWFDTNHDGIRQDSDRLLADVNVTLVDGNGRTVTSVDGKPCTATTDRNGHYEIGSIPAGSGFKLRFTPKTGTAWHGQNVTVKNAKEASKATDSDSDRENDSHGNMVAGVITLKPFPALDEMTSAVYEDPNEDHGMSGTLMPAVPATFKAVKVLDGRPNGAWTDRDRYVADITALDGAPANAVPSTITFTDNRTKTVKINSNAFPTDGVYRYQVKERKGDNPGVTYDNRTWILTVTVQDDLTTFTRRITANTTCDGVQSDAIQFTNTYAPKDTQARITASKLFTDADRSATKITDFQFDLYANDKATGTPIQTVNATADGRVEFAPLLFTKARLNGRDRAVFRYSVRERNTGAAGVQYDGHHAAWTVTVTDDNSGQLKANVTNPSETEGRFVNSYSSQPVTVTPKARKTLANPSGTLRLLNADEFTFELQDANGKTLQSKANKADGTVTFDKITYDTVGEHDYRIIEQSGKLAGITYDQTVHMMHVNVTDDGYGRLNAAVTYDNTPDVPVFRNTYQPKDVTVSLTARKTFDNADASHAKLTDFQFQLFDNERAVGVPVQTVNAAEDGTIRFQPLTFTAQQLNGARTRTFTYTVREIHQSAGGVNYDPHMGLWQITVTDDLTGRLKARTRTDAAYPTTFTNTYQAKPVSVQFRAHKTLNDPDHTGIRLQAGQYEFTCVEDKTGGQVGTAKTNDQRGDVLFDAISYTRPGTYDYTIRETPGDRGGVMYDAAKHHVRVTVTDDGEGQLLADVKYDGGTAIPEFTNTYRAQPATDTPTAVKRMSASEGNKYPLKGDDFAFTLHQQSAPANVSNPDQTKRNDRNGDIRFDRLSFPLVGTYVFTMSEQDTTVPGVTKDGTVATITYVVEDVGHTGRLSVTSKTVTPSTGDSDGTVTFTNRYNPKNVGYAIGGAKRIVNTDTATGRIPQDGEFTFQLNAASAHDSDDTPIDAGDIPMPDGSRDGKLTVANKGTGFTFGRMTYTKPGAYTYHVKELAGTDKTIGYSTQEYDVTVTVTDQGGMLSATADRQANDIRFDNTYTPTPVDVTVKADKHLTGRALNDGEFTAELKDMDGNTLQSKRFKRTTGSEAKADEGDGTLTFDKLTFGKTGIYRYTVDETDTQLGGVTYDTTSHTVTVTVTEDADSHTLTAKTEYSTENGSEDGIRFDNTYQPQNVLVELAARKRLTGRELKAGAFEFELVDKTGKVIDTERNDKDGDIRFKPLTYGRDNNGIDDCGEHRYVIRERNTGEKNVTYDRTEHHVTVTVGDDLQGNLTAKVEYDPTDGKTKDSSATPTDKADKTKGDAVGDKPSTTPGMVTITGTRPEFTNSYIPPATPAIVKTIRQLAKTGVSAPTVVLAAFTLLGVGLMLFRRRGNQTETARHRK